MGRRDRDRYVSAGFTLCFVAGMAALLLYPSSDFVPLLPADLIYGIGPIFVIGLAMLLVGRRAGNGEPTS